MIVSLRQLAELPAETFITRVVLARGTPAIASPIAEAFGIGFQRGAADNINRTALAHGEVMRRVEGLGGEVAPSAGEARDIHAVGRDTR